MDQSTVGIIILIGTLLLLMLIRIPIAFSLGISAVCAALYLDIPLINLFIKMVTSLQNFVIIAFRCSSAAFPVRPTRTYRPSAPCSSPR